MGIGSCHFAVCLLAILAALVMPLKIGVINDACIEKGNNTISDSIFSSNQSVIEIHWIYLDLSELYFIVQKVYELKRNKIDLVFVNSSDERISRTIAYLNVTPVIHLDVMDKKDIESLIKQDTPDNCKTSQVQTQPATGSTSAVTQTQCNTLSLEDHHTNRRYLTTMIVPVIKKLKWTLIILFYENATEHLLDVLAKSLAEEGIYLYTFNVDMMHTSMHLQEVLHNIYNAQVENMINVTIFCNLQCVQTVLSQANVYDDLPGNVRRTAMADRSSWFVITISEKQDEEVGKVSAKLNNVFILNLAIPSPDAAEANQQEDASIVDKDRLLDSLNNMTSYIGNGSKQSAFDVVQNYTTYIFGTHTCDKYNMYTLMWKNESNGKEFITFRRFEYVASADIYGMVNEQTYFLPNINFGFNGRRFLVTTRWWPPFTERIQENGSTVGYFGFCIDLLDVLSKELNFTYNLTEPQDGEWGTLLGNGSWTGMIGQLEKREVDLMVAATSIQAGREMVMDYTHPFYYDTSTILMKRPDPNDSKLFTLVKPFRWEVLVYIGLALPVSAVLLCLIELATPYYKSRGNEGKQSFQMSFWYMFGALLSQGGESLPNSQSGRTMISAFWLFSIVIVATYSGNLIAFLTVTIEKPPFNSMKELVARTDYTWGTLGGTYFITWFNNSKSSTLQDVWSGIKSFKETDTAVLHDDPNVHVDKILNEKYVYIGDKVYMDIRTANDCRLMTALEEVPNMQYGVGLPNNSQYTRTFSNTILALHESGLFQIFKQQHWPEPEFCPGALTAEAEPIELIDVQSAFYLIAMGIFAGGVTLGFENLFLWYTRKFRKLKEEDPVVHIRTISSEFGEFELRSNDTMSNGFISEEDKTHH